MEDFLTAEEVESLKSGCARLVEGMDPREHRGVFSTTEHNQVRSFGEEAWYVSKLAWENSLDIQ